MGFERENKLEKQLEIALTALREIIHECQPDEEVERAEKALKDIRNTNYEAPTILKWYEIVNGESIQIETKKGKYPDGSRFKVINNMFTRIDNASPPIEG